MKTLGGIFTGTDQIISQYFLGLKDSEIGKRSYLHKGESVNLKREFDAHEMLDALVKQIKKNLNDRSSKGNSTENWRESIQTNLDPSNKSKEIKLERKIAQKLESEFGDKSPWWNQMPIASGLVSSTADRRRAIDLVHRHEPDGKQYDFVELKIDSDTPLFALMEILRYGLVYLALREKRDWLPEISREKLVFDAEHIGLIVLAPQKYYMDCGLDLSWIEAIINRELPIIISGLKLSRPLAMDISSHFPDQLKEWDEKILARPLSVLDNWKAAYPL